MRDRIRTALLGCGKVGHTHAQALQALPQSDFVAVCSRSPHKVEHFARKYNTRGYTDLEQMVVEAKVQMVAICTPHLTARNTWHRLKQSSTILVNYACQMITIRVLSRPSGTFAGPV